MIRKLTAGGRLCHMILVRHGFSVGFEFQPALLA
jgi:hypothetical protein